ncbi:hypothetical protein DAI22_01g318400 [Oryza sativa Japonica Group]|nr:hypothetical protein DAI22_01g318400 [Oryza sativa Japonica Group]
MTRTMLTRAVPTGEQSSSEAQAQDFDKCQDCDVPNSREHCPPRKKRVKKQGQSAHPHLYTLQTHYAHIFFPVALPR